MRPTPSRANHRLALAALLSFVSTAGCALLVGADFGDKTLRGTGGATGTGGAVGAGGADDAGGDAHAVDGPTGPDAMSDGGPDAPASDGGSSPCSVQHTFCDDFDHEDDTFSAWLTASLPTDAGMKLEIATDYAVSAPNSLHASVSTNEDTNVSLSTILGAPMSQVHCELDVRHDIIASAQEVGATIVDFKIPGEEVTVNYRANGLLGVCTGTGTCGTGTFTSPLPGQWTHIVLDIDVGTGTAKLSLGKVGAVAPVATAQQSPTSPVGDAGASFTVGIIAPYQSVGPFDIHIDNTWCDVTP